MSCKISLAIALLFVSCLSVSPVVAQEKEQSYNVSVFSSYRSFPANEKAIAKTRKDVAAAFPGWVATIDKISGIFTDIYGKPVDLDGGDNKTKAINCISTRLNKLGVDKNEWQLVSSPSASGADYVNYSQIIKGHAVMFSKLSFRFTKAGALTRIQMKSYGRPATGTAPAVTKEAALKIAMQNIDGVTVTGSNIADQWSWFPVPAAKEYKLHPSWQFTVTGKIGNGMPVKLTGYVDAVTGELLYRNNEVKNTGFDLTVKGMVYKNGITSPATSEPLADLSLLTGLSSCYTDTGGNYTDALLTLPLGVDVPLTGRWSHVVDSSTGFTPVFTALAPGSSVYMYPVIAPSSSRHVNAYYHTTRIHNFMKQYFPSFTGLDTALLTNVDVSSGMCNAFFSGNSINFFAAGGGCNSFAEIGDVVYHEYGHAINNSFYDYISGGTMTNSSLHEGYADTWAFSTTHDPMLGKNAFVSGGYIRRYDVAPQVYPIDMDASAWFDPHKVGQIIAGSWWDLGVALGSTDSMTRLFTDVFYDTPDGPDGTEGDIFQSILISALLADDNDGDLSNGTPHYAKIVGAFAGHGIYLEGDAYLVHTELTDQVPGASIPVSATLSIANPSFFNDLTLCYRLNNTGSWYTVVLANSGFNFTGAIPAQPMGTVIEYYFVVHDALSTNNAYFPITCNASMPAAFTTIPYQFAVGIKSIGGTDFELPAGDYDIGHNTGDNASGGIWYQGHPSGLLVTDHTTGTPAGTCLESKSMGFGMHGTSTVITPVFDISGFSQPVISYYRWFSNETDNMNFKNDPWVVKIRDASGSAWTNVEYTYQCDDNWRRRVVPVMAYLPASATQVQLKFFASDSMRTDCISNGQSDLTSAIDDIFIYDKGVPNSVHTVEGGRASIYPNPADDNISITFASGGAGAISLWNMNGQKVSTINTQQQTKQYLLNTHEIAPGNYNLVVETPAGIEMKKVVITHR